MGKFYDTTADTANGDFVNGREFTVASVGSENVGGTLNYYVECSTAGMNFPDSDFSLALTTGGDTDNQANVYSSESTAVEAFFEGAQNVYKGADVNFSNKKIVVREIGTSTKHDYTNAQVVTKTTGEGTARNIIDNITGVFSLTDDKYKLLCNRVKHATHVEVESSGQSVFYHICDADGIIITVNQPCTLQKNGAWFATNEEKFDGFREKNDKGKKFMLRWGQRRPRKSKELATSTNMYLRLTDFL